MGRHGYSDDLDQQDLAMWRGRVASASRGKRGQKLLKAARSATDASQALGRAARSLPTPPAKEQP